MGGPVGLGNSDWDTSLACDLSRGRPSTGLFEGLERLFRRVPVAVVALYRRRDLNPHGCLHPGDFKCAEYLSWVILRLPMLLRNRDIVVLRCPLFSWVFLQKCYSLCYS